MEIGYTYSVDKECPICGKKTKVTKVRSRLIKVSQDFDFCNHYKDFNPYYYSVWVCSHCGYAADEAHFSMLAQKDKDKISGFLDGKEVKLHFKEERTRNDAIAAFKLGIFFADMIETKPSYLAGMYLKLAWMYREAEEEEQELDLLARALEYYDKSLTTERYPIGSMTDNAVMYLIGALHYKTGDLEKATQYLSRIVGSEKARLETNIYKKARDLWQDIRQEKEKALAEAQ